MPANHCASRRGCRNMSKSSYEALRHSCPDIVRTIRCVFDVGVKESVIIKAVKKHSADEDAERIAIEAVKYMQANPDAGVVRYHDGTYSFIERVAAGV